jgi:hypothetical protein
VPPEDSTFAAMVGNIPVKYMRAHIMTGNDSESWQWQLPDVMPGQTISFRMVDAAVGSGVPPQFVRKRDPHEAQENKKQAQELYAKVKRERARNKRKKR